MQNVQTLVLEFLRDERTFAIFALIAVDVVTGIIAALRSRTFQWRAVGDFYGTNVLPYVLGYLLIYGLSVFGVTEFLGALAGELSATIGVAPATVALGASIGRNLQNIRSREQPASRIDDIEYIDAGRN